MDPLTIGSAIVLAVVTSLVAIFILRATKPGWALRPDGTVDSTKVVMYGVTASLLFTILVTMLSLHVDRVCAEKKAAEGHGTS